MDRISVVVADDHELVRFALRTLLDAEPDMIVIGEASDSEAAVRACLKLKPNVLLLDLHMAGAGGAEVCRRVREESPETAVLVLTGFVEDDDVFSVLEAGACGYLLKDMHPDQVAQAVRTVANGQSVFDPDVAKRIIAGRAHEAASENDTLSHREMEVLRLMATGLSNKDIGRALWISEATVKTHVSHILRKLGQADRTQAVLTAVRSGIVSLAP